MIIYPGRKRATVAVRKTLPLGQWFSDYAHFAATQRKTKHASMMVSHSDRKSFAKWRNILQGKKKINRQQFRYKQDKLGGINTDQLPTPKSREYGDTYLVLGFTVNVVRHEERPVCVFCLKTQAAEKMKPNKFKRHLETPHPSVGHLSSFKDKHWPQHLAQKKKLSMLLQHTKQQF